MLIFIGFFCPKQFLLHPFSKMTLLGGREWFGKGCHEAWWAAVRWDSKAINPPCLFHKCHLHLYDRKHLWVREMAQFLPRFSPYLIVGCDPRVAVCFFWGFFWYPRLGEKNHVLGVSSQLLFATLNCGYQKKIRGARPAVLNISFNQQLD